MSIEVTCRGCNARYRVKDELAGRMAECKHCGQKFRVPYRSAVVRLGDEEEVAAPTGAPEPKPAESKTQRSFVEYGLDPDDPAAPIMKRKKDRPKVTQGILPELVADLWLPLGLMVVTYGIALYVSLSAMLHSNGPLAGCILLGIVVASFFAFVIPMTMRMLEGASKTLDFEAPNAIWLQTAACVGVPTMGMVVGYFGVGSIVAMVAFGVIGFAVTCPLMALMFRIDFLKGIQAAVLGALFYAMSVAITGAVMAAVGLWLMPLWHITRPWDEKPAEVATSAAEPAPAPQTKKNDAPAPAPAPVALAVDAKASAPKPDATLATAEPTKTTDPWEVPTDAVTPVRWPADVAHVLTVRAPLNVLQTSALEPFVAVVDQDATKVFDLRSGKRVGVINERPRERVAAISKDGAFIAFEVAMTSGAAIPPSIEIWSVTDGRMALRVPSNGAVRALGFDPSGRAYVLNNESGKRVVQTWDPRTRRQVSTTGLEGNEGSCAVSPNARLMASVQPGQLRVYDLAESKLVGQRPIELGFRQVGTVAFSPDGTRLAAAVMGDRSPTPRILVWDIKDGAMTLMEPAAVVAGDVDKLDFQWLPDGDGFLMGGQLVDRASGKTIHVPTPPTAGTAVGRPRVALSNFRVLYEMLPPPGSDRLIYRAYTLPKADVIASIKALRGANWQPVPESEPASAVALASAQQAPASQAAAAGPATKPINPAAMKEWVVTVLAVIVPDGPSIQRQLNAEQARLAPLETKQRLADRRADEISGEYIITRDAFGAEQKTHRYSNNEISEARGAAKKALEEVKDVKVNMARLTRELKAVATSRVVTGTLDNGISVTIIVDGAPLVALVDPLNAGDKVKVTGGPLYANNMLTIKLRTLTPVE